jgi:hypothetical protein
MVIRPAKPEILLEEISLVLVGDFNPTIFHPMWFLYEGLIRKNEAEEAIVDVLHQDVSLFRLDWLTVQVLRDRFTATIKVDVFKKHLGDLVLNAFSKLNHTPIRQFGMNATFRARFKSTGDWHGFGHFLLPKSPWNNVLNKPGMMSCNVMGTRHDNRPGYVRIYVDPDISTQRDVLIRINDHFDAPDLNDGAKGAPFSANWAVEIMCEDFESSMDRAIQYTNALVDNYLCIVDVDSGV